MTRDLLIERWNPTEICFNGDAHWLNDKGELHRKGDQPAVVDANGTTEWFKNGEEHRDNDKPTVITEDGTMEWWKDGVRHRDGDQPAIIWLDGYMEWYINGEEYIVIDFDSEGKRKSNVIKGIVDDG